MTLYQKNISFLLKSRGIRIEEIGGVFPSAAKEPSLGELIMIADHFGLPLDLLLRSDLKARAAARSKKIRLLVMDIDGVLTDAGMYYTENGDELKKFNAKDGLAIRDIKKKKIKTGIITHGFNMNLIRRRSERLHIDLLEVSQKPKLATLNAWCKKLKISIDNVAYIGDDINDSDVLRAVGFSACPADAVDAVKNMCHVVLTKKGGEGCVREMIDHYLS
ncbi:MAG: 3-deoxy-D-manno-octulosonate 8-phosphate phosphatase [Bacteroidetes bacterium]|nr:MAG: 3-deoxy-D-manno-octulosonate 8-phosphate phosphatase [Bacteroidota bacterium]